MLGLFALLLVGYTLLALWPLAEFIRADKYSPQFRLSVYGNDEYCKDVMDGNGNSLEWKNKGYLTNDWVRHCTAACVSSSPLAAEGA